MGDPIARLRPTDLLANAIQRMADAKIPVSGIHVGKDIDGIGHANLLVLDADGRELTVLQSARAAIGRLDGIHTRINRDALDGMTIFLERLGFRMRWMWLDEEGDGNVFFCRPMSAAH